MNKILIVEDDESYCLILERLLVKHGFEVTDTVTTGEKALESITRQIPDLVLMDVMLPGKIDGIEAGGKILEKWSIPVIYISAVYNEDVVERAAKTLPYAYLHKPVERHQVIAEIKLALLRKQAEDKLKEQKARSESDLSRAMQLWDMTFDAVPELIAIVDESSNIIQVNTAMDDRLGTTKDYLKGKKCFQALDGLDAPPDYCPYQHIHKSGQIHRLEEYKKNLDGYFSIVCIPFMEASTGKTVSVHVLQDITERKNYEEQLKHSEEKFRRLSEDMPMLVCTYLPDSSLTYVNKAYCDYFGKSEKDLIGSKWLDFIPIDTRKEARSTYQALTPDNPLAIHDYQVLKPDRTNGWQKWTVRALFDDHGQLLYYQAIGSDITTQRQATNRLKDNEKVLNAVLKAIKVSMVVVDLKTRRIKRLNETSLRFFKDKDALNQDFERVMKSVFESNYKNLDDIISKLPIHNEEIKMKTRDGTIVPVLFNALLGELEYRKSLILIFLDISARKSLEMQLAHAQKLEAVGELAAGIAHEINTPVQYLGDNTLFLKEAFEDILRQIDIFGEKLKMMADDSMLELFNDSKEEIDLAYLASEIPKAIDQSLYGVDRIASIVKAMKKFAHPTQNDEMSYFDLQDALENTITISRNEWKYVADIITDFGSDLSEVQGYPYELNQVFLNLTVNAAQAIKEKVEGTENRGEIRIKADVVDNFAEISISDTGTGIMPEHQNRVFNQFFTTKPVGKGTGQGLAIAYSIIVDKHKGSISFESEPDKGTTFFIKIPQNPRDNLNGQN